MADFSTPESALRSLEEAYRRRDIEAAVRAKDFRLDGAHMVRHFATGDASADEALIDEAAEVLELAYRADLATTGVPDMSGVRTTILDSSPRTDDVVLLTELVEHADGRQSIEKVWIARTDAGWRVILLPPEDPA